MLHPLHATSNCIIVSLNVTASIVPLGIHIQNGDVIIQNVRTKQAETKNADIGYNVLTGEYVDMISAGIIDPAKVTRGALENAASIAAMILTTEALITDIPEPEPSMPPGGPGGGMGGF